MLGIAWGFYFWGLGICAGLIIHAAWGSLLPRAKRVAFASVIFIFYMLAGADLVLSSFGEQLLLLDESALGRAFAPSMGLLLLGAYQSLDSLQRKFRPRK